MIRRIDIIVKFFHPVTAGIETNILETYSVLVNKGWDVRVHTTMSTHTATNVLPKFETIRGIKVYRYKYTKFGYFPKINRDESSLICLHNFNVTPHVLFMLYALWDTIRGQKKYGLILTPHGGYTPDWYVFSPVVAFLKKIYHFTLGTLLINLTVDALRAVSHWEAEQILSKGIKKEKVFVITNGIEDEAFVDLDKNSSNEIREQVKKFGIYIIQVGRIYPIKNYETTIRALASVPDNVKFVITGANSEDPNYLNTLHELIDSLGLRERVIFTGVVKGVDKFYLMSKATMMVHMARWESFCNVVHEGMSQGLVCLVANNTALPYLIKDGENGFCIETNDSEALAIKINYVLNNKSSKRIAEIKKRNLVFGRQERWSSVADKMHKLYIDSLKGI